MRRYSCFSVTVLWFLAALACEPEPHIDALTPSRGPVDQEMELLIRGQGFADGLKAELNSAAFRFDLSVISVRSDQIVARLAPGIEAGVYDLHVRNPGGARDRLPAAYTALNTGLTLVVLDVGQGAALLAVGTDGSSLLFDGGKSNRGSRVLWPAIDRYAEGRLDAVVVSHFDIDHMGGLVEVLRGVDGTAGTADDPVLPLGLFDNGAAAGCSTAICESYRQAAAGRNRRIALGQILQLGEASVRCVAVGGQVQGGARDLNPSDNDASVGLLFELGGASLLVAGDLSAEGHPNLEAALATALGPVDLWAINHHGSATATSQAALDALRPRAALLSVGRDNSYCHPAQEVVDRLDVAALPVYLTEAGVTQPSANCDEITRLGPRMRVVGDIEINIDVAGNIEIAGEAL